MSAAPEPVLRFRNYAPRDAALAQHAAPPPPLPSALAPTAPGADPALPSPGAPVLLVPKRANWDLKRDLAPKLEALERMTQRAIAELVHSKVAAAAAPALGAAAGSSSSSGRVGGGGGGAAGGSGGPGAAPAAERLDDVYEGPIDTALLSAKVASHEAGAAQ